VIRARSLVHAKILHPDRLGHKHIIRQTWDFAIKNRAGIGNGVLGNQIALSRRFNHVDAARVWHHIQIADNDFFLS
jgi:hypothetical protein